VGSEAGGQVGQEVILCTEGAYCVTYISALFLISSGIGGRGGSVVGAQGL
jgi:hypothetical protein